MADARGKLGEFGFDLVEVCIHIVGDSIFRVDDHHIDERVDILGFQVSYQINIQPVVGGHNQRLQLVSNDVKELVNFHVNVSAKAFFEFAKRLIQQILNRAVVGDNGLLIEEVLYIGVGLEVDLGVI